MPVIIKQCSCEHEFQDKMYGKKMRVFNTLGDSMTKGHCSVCKKEL